MSYKLVTSTTQSQIAEPVTNILLQKSFFFFSVHELLIVWVPQAFEHSKYI